MRRIKLPGSIKSKKIVLLILIIVSIFILIFEGVKNNNINKRDKIIENKIIESNDKENENSIISENSKTKVSEDTKKQTILYDEAYNLFFSKEYEESINKSTELITQYPNDAKGYNIRGIAKAYNGDFEEGMKDIDKSLNLEPQYGYAIFNKALTYELYNKLDEALMWYNKNLEVEQYVWTYYGISSIYGRKGDIDNTVVYLKKAIELDPAVKEEAKTEKDFDLVREYKEFQDLIM